MISLLSSISCKPIANTVLMLVCCYLNSHWAICKLPPTTFLLLTTLCVLLPQCGFYE